MNRILLFLMLLTSSASFAQQRVVRGFHLNGRIAKIEYRERLLTETKNGEVIENKAIDGMNFYFDENMNLVKEEQYIDYTRLDPSGKTKVKVIPVEVTPTKPEPPVDTTYERTDTSVTKIIPYDGTGYILIHIFKSSQDHELWSIFDKDKKLAGRQMRVFYPNGVMKERSWYKSPDYEVLSYREEYDAMGNKTNTRPFKNGKWQDPTSVNLMKYDDHYNVGYCQHQELDEATGELVAKYNYYLKYTYAKGDPGPPKKEASASQDGKSSSEGEEKKGVFDKINPFKKKKNKEDQ